MQAYNGLGQRVRKSVSGSGAGTTLFAYDEAGRLLGSYVPDSGAPGGFRVQEELVWLDVFRPVLSVRPNATTGMTSPDYYPILTDYLGTPRKVLNDDGDAVWSWDAKEPFGNSTPNENPSSLGVFKFNLRFPGQWFDQETGLHHNGFRDYHPGLGRYVQSDPLGLEAGWNTYGYVGGSPIGYSDPFGLDIIQDAFDYWQPPSLNQGFVNLSAGFGDDVTWGLTGLVRTRILGNNVVDECSTSYKAGGYAAFLAMPVKGGAQRSIVSIGKYSVGSYRDLRAAGTIYDAHHVGQKALMGKFIPGYDPRMAPSILVPKEGHTIKNAAGNIVSRSTTGLTTPRQVVARDIRELRRVYPDVPNSALQGLIKRNKEQYPTQFGK